MWLSRQMSEKHTQQDDALLGTISIEGVAPAAVTDCENRNLRVLAPGGYQWVPQEGQAVLILKGTTVLGQQMQAEDLRPGEVRLHADGCEIVLRSGGEIHLNGRLFLNGVEVGNGK